MQPYGRTLDVTSLTPSRRTPDPSVSANAAEHGKCNSTEQGHSTLLTQLSPCPVERCRSDNKHRACPKCHRRRKRLYIRPELYKPDAIRNAHGANNMICDSMPCLTIAVAPVLDTHAVSFLHPGRLISRANVKFRQHANVSSFLQTAKMARSHVWKL